MTSLPMTYLADGNVTAALSWVMGDYVGFGILWLFMAIMVFALTYIKTESYGISGIIFTVFVSMIAPFLPAEVQKYFLLIIGLMLAILAIKLFMDK